MKRNQFRQLNNCGHVSLSSHYDVNFIPSVTDPTQEVTIQQCYDAMRTGKLLDVPIVNSVFNGVKVDDLSSVETRGTDKFDVHAEFRFLEKNMRNNLKKSNKNEIEKN